MNTKLISERALAVIDQYTHFQIGQSVCSIPYYNNRRGKIRAGIRALTGKGSLRDIFDETEIESIKEKVVDIFKHANESETLKKFLVDHNIGIDCSGLVYYILNAEGIARGKSAIDRYLSFPYSHGFIRKLKSKLRPAENTDVMTLAHDKNSRVVAVKNAEVGDMITMLKRPDAPEEERARDHILVIHQIEYQNFAPMTIHYTHSVAWPSDGTYGHGIRQGRIEVIDSSKSIVEQKWIENEKIGADKADGETSENYTFTRAKKSVTEIRRLNYL